MDFDPSGRGATKTFRVENQSREMVAVQINCVRREIDAQGKETHFDMEDDFIVYPPQILLRPGQSQALRVSYIGNPQPAKEIACRIIAEQLPIDLKKQEAGGTAGNIKLVVRYIGSIYITPKGARSNVQLVSAGPSHSPDGAPALLITLRNDGTARALLRDLKMRLTSNGKSVELGPDQLPGMAGEVILAGGIRSFVLPYPAQLPKGAVQVAFEFDTKR